MRPAVLAGAGPHQQLQPRSQPAAAGELADPGRICRSAHHRQCVYLSAAAPTISLAGAEPEGQGDAAGGECRPSGDLAAQFARPAQYHTEYVYTDPDVVPIEACPRDLVGMLQSILDDNPTIATAGVCLRLDDLPDTYRYKAQAIAWERQFWLNPAAPGLFHAPIDTTLALYRPEAGHSLGLPTIRTGWPDLCGPRGRTLNHLRPSEEDLFYQGAVAADTSHWSTAAVPAWLESCGHGAGRRQPSLLHVGRGGVGLPRAIDMLPTTGRCPSPSVRWMVSMSTGRWMLDRRSNVGTGSASGGEARRTHGPPPAPGHGPPDRGSAAAPVALGQRLAPRSGHAGFDLDVGPYDGELWRAGVPPPPVPSSRVMAQLRAVTADELQPVLPTIAVGDMDGWSGFTLLPSGM